MSRAERKHLEIEDTKRAVYLRDRGLCQACRKQIGPAGHCGHVIPQSQIDRFGEGIIHHPLNMKWVCSLRCNHAVEISYKGHPIAAEEHAARVREIMEAECHDSKSSG